MDRRLTGRELFTPPRVAILAIDGWADDVAIDADEDACALLSPGRRIDEPTAQQGLFVTNTNDEVYRTAEDCRNRRLAYRQHQDASGASHNFNPATSGRRAVTEAKLRPSETCP